MSLFGKDKKEEKKESPKENIVSDEKKETKVVNKKKEAESAPSIRKAGNELPYKFLVEPWVTERTHNIMSLGKYVFRVHKRANKMGVRRAIESAYGVTVEKVNIINIPSKSRRSGRSVGTKPGFKKAIVSLKEGDKIDLFEGV